MNILILGGTLFLGPHLIAAAQERGHTVTLFNRGKSRPEAFSELEQLRGDRLASDLDALRGRSWDAVIDTCAYIPRVVSEVLDALGDQAPYYQLVTTLSVFDTNAPVPSGGLTEEGPRGVLDDPTDEQLTAETYGPLKALCEDVVLARRPDTSAIVRPGLIVGPNDLTDRFTYWPHRIRRGGEFIAPIGPEEPVQIIDVRDLAAWMIHLAETRTTGVFNAVSPPDQFTIGDVIDASLAVTGADATPAWFSAEELETAGIQPWADLPAWVPSADHEGGFGPFNVDRALAAGMTCRSLEETARGALAWFDTLPEERRAKLRAGLSAEREQEALRARAQATT